MYVKVMQNPVYDSPHYKISTKEQDKANENLWIFGR